jgi:nitrite reductase/ring-hydroxylating ferredoxin subunit
MLSKLLSLLRGKPVRIQGTSKLPSGHAKLVALGDPLAGGTEIVLCRVGATLHAVDRRCPHEGGRLTDGPLAEGKYVVCPLHNYKFDPATGKAIEVTCASAKVYRVRERDGDAEVWA